MPPPDWQFSRACLALKCWVFALSSKVDQFPGGQNDFTWGGMVQPTAHSQIALQD